MGERGEKDVFEGEECVPEGTGRGVKFGENGFVEGRSLYALGVTAAVTGTGWCEDCGRCSYGTAIWSGADELGLPV